MKPKTRRSEQPHGTMYAGTGRSQWALLQTSQASPSTGVLPTGGSPSLTASKHRGLRKRPPGLLSLVAQPPFRDRAPPSQLSSTVTLRLREEKVKIKLGNGNKAKKHQNSCCHIFNSTCKQPQGELMEREKPSAKCSAKAR